MKIKTKDGDDIEIFKNNGYMSIVQDNDDDVCIDKDTARQLIEVLKEWVGDE